MSPAGNRTPGRAIAFQATHGHYLRPRAVSISDHEDSDAGHSVRGEIG